jgi:thymidylate synthase (FAD)
MKYDLSNNPELANFLDTTLALQGTSIPLYQDGIGRVEYIQHMGTDLTMVNSARVSFGTSSTELTQRDKKLINHLINKKHTSTLEHNVITFKFVVPIFVRSQHHRHRTWSYNEISRRYTQKDLQFYTPSEFRTQHKSDRQASNLDSHFNPTITPSFVDTYVETDKAVKAFKDSALDLYNQMLNKGVCKEQARMVLPQNMYTEYYGTTNLNNAFKFLYLRLDKHAQWEIIKVAEAMLEILVKAYPYATQVFINSLKDNPNYENYEHLLS